MGLYLLHLTAKIEIYDKFHIKIVKKTFFEKKMFFFAFSKELVTLKNIRSFMKKRQIWKKWGWRLAVLIRIRTWNFEL